MTLNQKAFNVLTNKQQEVWGPIMQDCLTQYATAKMLGISRNAVKDRLNKAKKHFKAYIVEARRLKQIRREL